LNVGGELIISLDFPLVMLILVLKLGNEDVDDIWLLPADDRTPGRESLQLGVTLGDWKFVQQVWDAQGLPLLPEPVLGRQGKPESPCREHCLVVHADENHMLRIHRGHGA